MAYDKIFGYVFEKTQRLFADGELWCWNCDTKAYYYMGAFSKKIYDKIKVNQT